MHVVSMSEIDEVCLAAWRELAKGSSIRVAKVYSLAYVSHIVLGLIRLYSFDLHGLLTILNLKLKNKILISSILVYISSLYG